MSDNQSEDKLEIFSYALGMNIASNLIQSGIDKIDSKKFLAGFNDTLKGNKPLVSMDEAHQMIQEFMLAQNEEESLRNFEESVLYLFNNINNEGVVETDTGLQFKILKEGYGKSPTIDDKIKCHYHGILLDGTVFDSSIERNDPAIFPVRAVIRGWVEALQNMRVGAKWRLFIPPNLAYGEAGSGGIIGPNAMLIIDVELLEIV